MNFLLGGWKKWAAVGLVVAAIGAYAGWLKVENAQYETEIVRQGAVISDLTQANIETSNTLARVQADAKRAEAATAAARKEATAAQAKLREIGKEIERVPSNERATLSPGVRRALERLWETPAGRQ